MITIIWKFQIDILQATEFKKIYGPMGAWSMLFQRSKEYHGTLLLQDQVFSDVYVTVDRWDNLAAFENFKMQFRDAYNKLDFLCEKLTLSEQKIGVFEEVL